MRKVLLVSGAIFSGMLSSVCCLGPLLFSVIGTGFAGLTSIEKYRSLFIIFSLLFLGISWIFTLRKREICLDKEKGICEKRGPGKLQIILMAILTFVVFFLLLFPQFLTFIRGV